MLPKEALGKRPQRLPEPQLSRLNTALLVIDMQYAFAYPEYGVCARLQAGGDRFVFESYTQGLKRITGNIALLLETFRRHKMEVIFTRIESLTQDGRDRSLEHKCLNIHHPPGSKDAQIVKELAPEGDEIVLSKTCGSVFNGTMLHYVLRNIGITNLVLTGVVTSGCIESAARDAADQSYSVIVVEDACATWLPEKHAASINAMDETFAKIKDTAQVLQIVNSLPQAVD